MTWNDKTRKAWREFIGTLVDPQPDPTCPYALCLAANAHIAELEGVLCRAREAFYKYAKQCSLRIVPVGENEIFSNESSYRHLIESLSSSSPCRKDEKDATKD